MDEAQVQRRTRAQLREEMGRMAGDQYGLVTRTQLRDIGFSDPQIKRLIAGRTLHSVRRGVFATVGVPDSWERGLLATLLSVGHPVAASHSSAASLWTFSVMPERRYELTIPRDRIGELDGVRIHRSSHFEDIDFTSRFGIRCTTFERTLCDLTTVFSEKQLGRILNDGLRRKVASLQRLRDCAERIESGPGRHMSAIRSLLAARDVDFDPGGSDPELRIWNLVHQADLPIPAQQRIIRVNGITYRPDYVWEPYMAFAEYYGMADHTGDAAVIYDSARLTDLVRAGWTPMIFTKADSDERIIATIRDTLERLDRLRVGRVMGA